MKPALLLHHLVAHCAEKSSGRIALRHKQQSITYAELHHSAQHFAAGLKARKTPRYARVGIYLSKCFEYITAVLGASIAGCTFVPINPALKASQLKFILTDCDVDVLVTSAERYLSIESSLPLCSNLQVVVLKKGMPVAESSSQPYRLCQWDSFLQDSVLDIKSISDASIIDQDMAAIFYTSGSTGKPKGVVVSHRNLVTGAASVANYLKQEQDDVIMAALPFSFDAGFSQLTTAFTVGAKVILHDYTTAKEALKVMASERVTGMTAVPPLWIQLAEHPWPEAIAETFRYFANTGGAMPSAVLNTLTKKVPAAHPYLMYGLTEAFRSTYLDPEEVARRSDSIGKAIPNQDVMVLRPDLSPCDAGELGELVHRGSTVSLGYWNAPELTAKRFRQFQVPAGPFREETAVFSGDIVYRDEQGYLYFVGRNDELIKSSGYRISPTEIEDAAYNSDLIYEAVAFGTPDPQLGQSIILVVYPKSNFEEPALRVSMGKVLTSYMLPKTVVCYDQPLPRNGNNKIDRAALKQTIADNLAETIV